MINELAYGKNLGGEPVGLLAVDDEVERAYVSPKRLPPWKSSILFDPKHPVYGVSEEVLDIDEQVETCPNLHPLKFVKGDPYQDGANSSTRMGIVDNCCNKCLLPGITNLSEGYGWCEICNYTTCFACMKTKPKSNCVKKPRPPEAIAVEEKNEGLPYSKLPDSKTGKVFTWVSGGLMGSLIGTAKALTAPPAEAGFLLPVKAGDPPQCAAAAIKVLGGTQQAPAIAKAVNPKSLLGGEPLDAGPPVGRRWITRGDDIVSRGKFITPIPIGAPVCWRDPDYEVVRVGRVKAILDNDEYSIKIIYDERGVRRPRLSCPPSRGTTCAAMHLAVITEKDIEVIVDQQNKIENELIETVARCLSLIEGCTHTSKPYIKREKGNPRRGYSCLYVQCRWCGKVLVVNYQQAGKQRGDVTYSRIVLDEIGEAMLVMNDPYAKFRSIVVPSLPHGIRRSDGRGWSRKAILLLPEIALLNRQNYLHTADSRQLSFLRSRAKDISTFEKIWLDLGSSFDWHVPKTDTQTLFGPSHLVPGSSPLPDPTAMLHFRSLLRKADERRKEIREKFNEIEGC